MKFTFPTVKLGELTTKIGSGSTPKGGETVYKAAGVPFIRSQNVHEDHLDLTTVAFIDEATHVKMKGSSVRPNDVLLNITGASIGRCCVAPKSIKNANVSQHVCIIRLTKNADPHFIATYLNSWYGQKQIESFQGGGSREGLNFDQIGLLEIPHLSINEQVRIGQLLEKWNNGIAICAQARDLYRAKLEAHRRNFLTGRIRIKGFSTPWKSAKLQEVLDEHGTLSSGNEMVYSVSVHEGLVNQVEHLGRSFAAATTDHYNLVKPGDLVYTKSPTGDFPLGIIKQSKVDKNVIVSPLYGVFTPKTRELGVLLDCYFESPANAFNYLHPIVQRGAKNTISITNKTFLSNSLLLPTDPEEQKALAGFVELAKREIRLLEKQVEAYRRQKRGLMQKLLTGEWRVKS